MTTTANPDALIAAANERSRAEAKNLEASLRAAYLDRALAGATLGDFTAEEQKYLDHAMLSRLRRAAYIETVGAMPTPIALLDWDAAMTKRYGPTAILHGHELRWLPLLRLVRWGEEPTKWPAAWDDNDVQRAELWLTGEKHPTFLTYLIGPDRTPITPNPGRRIAIG